MSHHPKCWIIGKISAVQSSGDRPLTLHPAVIKESSMKLLYKTSDSCVLHRDRESLPTHNSRKCPTFNLSLTPFPTNSNRFCHELLTKADCVFHCWKRSSKTRRERQHVETASSSRLQRQEVVRMGPFPSVTSRLPRSLRWQQDGAHRCQRLRHRWSQVEAAAAAAPAAWRQECCELWCLSASREDVDSPWCSLQENRADGRDTATLFPETPRCAQMCCF